MSRLIGTAIAPENAMACTPFAALALALALAGWPVIIAANSHAHARRN
jgi:hypothetical protein